MMLGQESHGVHYNIFIIKIVLEVQKKEKNKNNAKPNTMICNE